MVTAAIFALATSPSLYMERAFYPAASPIQDSQAPGGFAESDNFPVKNDSKTPKEFITLKRKGDSVEITIANHDQKDLWFRAADGNLILWLEAKDGETWKPIQFHMWYTCGNSYHRVNLPIGTHLTYKPQIAGGFLLTDVRLAYYTEATEENASREVAHSPSIRFPIAQSLFTLDPVKYADQRVNLDWTTPTLVPNG